MGGILCQGFLLDEYEVYILVYYDSLSCLPYDYKGHLTYEPRSMTMQL